MMENKRFTEIISIQKVIDNQTGKEYDCLIDDGLLELLNELHKENQRLKDQYERKDRQLKRTKKDIQKYTDYFMNELEWDCDRIIKEVFR